MEEGRSENQQEKEEKKTEIGMKSEERKENWGEKEGEEREIGKKKV